jgi:hypothetical protein
VLRATTVSPMDTYLTGTVVNSLKTDVMSVFPTIFHVLRRRPRYEYAHENRVSIVNLLRDNCCLVRIM